jgi:hypothetical protein
MSEVQCEILKNCAGPAIQNQKRVIMTSGVVLLYDNARPYTAARTQAVMEYFIWELFDHRPYNLDLAPNDYHLFTYLKKWFRSQRFSNTEEFMGGVKTWLSSQAADFFDTGIQKHFPIQLLPQFRL